jgi:hypothetical protein
MNIAGVLMIDHTTQSCPDPYYLAIDFIPKSTPFDAIETSFRLYVCWSRLFKDSMFISDPIHSPACIFFWISVSSSLHQLFDR